MTVTSHSPTIPPPPAGEHRPLITCSFPNLPDADLHRVTVDVFGNYRADAGSGDIPAQIVLHDLLAGEVFILAGRWWEEKHDEQ